MIATILLFGLLSVIVRSVTWRVESK